MQMSSGCPGILSARDREKSTKRGSCGSAIFRGGAGIPAKSSLPQDSACDDKILPAPQSPQQRVKNAVLLGSLHVDGVQPEGSSNLDEA